MQQCLVSSRGKIHEKNWGPNLGDRSKIGLEIMLYHFLKFGSLVFLEIACNDILQQCKTSSRGKTHKKNLGDPNIGQTGQNWVQK